ncbi:hypothetical protein EZV76_14420 [Flagellimonas alvinocaridis]|uniref:DUF4380 domain-containing protein n=1 Tax=Flagellimonas alvinocaridis TaxID=2530200 RepID=A0A4S8RV36_9FLAO|nr:hypothetical protein [Allomuricauda alvinocaridis]THV57784.1 hypothetical protein EZV76_14420 [Allomuricauda alvinocaridis]
MKNNKRIVFFLGLLTTFGWAQQQAPQVKIHNENIIATLYLPDKDKGYYRASRFDWAGVIPKLEYKGHAYFGQWFKDYDPLSHDAIMGPVEDFKAVGFEQAKAGEVFLKIGVGLLKKDDGKSHSFSKTYDIIDYGKRKVKVRTNAVTFHHEITSEGYSYNYEKKVKLIKDKPQLVLQHRFKNTGKLPIESLVNNHNFFVMDGIPIGPGYSVIFPFTLTDKDGVPYASSAEKTGLKDYAKIEGNKVVFTKELIDDFAQIRPAFGYDYNDPKDYDIRLENREAGIGVRITCDQPISSLAVWSAPQTICPQPYINVKVAPGEVFTWTITYTFYTL